MEVEIVNSEELSKITESIKEKIGEDLTSTIADDLGLLITSNNQVLKEIEKYKSFYEKYPDRYKQVMIDALEERLDMFRRDENV